MISFGAVRTRHTGLPVLKTDGEFSMFAVLHARPWFVRAASALSLVLGVMLFLRWLKRFSR